MSDFSWKYYESPARSAVISMWLQYIFIPLYLHWYILHQKHLKLITINYMAQIQLTLISFYTMIAKNQCSHEPRNKRSEFSQNFWKTVWKLYKLVVTMLYHIIHMFILLSTLIFNYEIIFTFPVSPKFI